MPEAGKITRGSTLISYFCLHAANGVSPRSRTHFTGAAPLPLPANDGSSLLRMAACYSFRSTRYLVGGITDATSFGARRIFFADFSVRKLEIHRVFLRFQTSIRQKIFRCVFSTVTSRLPLSFATTIVSVFPGGVKKIPYSSQLPTVRGKGSTSRMLLIPVRYITQRSKPRPKPA